jgi:hypothetical protein
MSSWIRLFHAILGSRVILQLRAANEDGIVPEIGRGRNSFAVLPKLAFRPVSRNTAPPRSFAEIISEDIEEWLSPNPAAFTNTNQAQSFRSDDSKTITDSNEE